MRGAHGRGGEELGSRGHCRDSLLTIVPHSTGDMAVYVRLYLQYGGGTVKYLRLALSVSCPSIRHLCCGS
jgi:hypothetical protein